MFGRWVLGLLLVLPSCAWACSKHGTSGGSEITVDYKGDADGDGLLLFVVGIEDEIVEPTEPTTCVTAIGLGSTGRPLPADMIAVSARIDRVNRATGEETRVQFFRFAADQETTQGMAQGGGSGANDPRPLVDGAGWFGFSSAVNPFLLETGPDEYIRMTFEVLVPKSLAPLITDVQFGSGEGEIDGTPIFTGEHPVQYYSGRDPEAEFSKFMINAGLNDAWYNPETAGQGILVSVFPDEELLFIAWFTYDLERPGDDVEAQLGDPGHRWLTAAGKYAEDRAVLDIDVASGGVFDSAVPVVEHTPDGSMIIEFTSCTAGTVTYDIPSVDRQGVIPLERIALDNVPLCEELDKAAAAQQEPL
jgi:hypothetical protein